MRFPVLLLVAVAVLSMGPTAPVRADPPSAGEAGPVPLTDDEIAWIAAHPVIRAGHDPGFSPYAIEDASGRIVGIDPDYLELISRRTGLKFKSVARRDWGEMLGDFKAGKVDVLLSLNRAPEREGYLIYTDSYAYAYNVIVTRKDEPNLSTLSDLTGHTIALARGDALLRQGLDEKAPGNRIVEYESPADCYKAVASGEVYAAVGDAANAAYYLRADRLENLRIGGVVSRSAKIYIGVRRDWPMLAQIINKALSGITAADRQRINDRWIAVDASAGRRWARAFKVVAAIAAGAVAVFLLAFYHDRRLARELAERVRIQSELELARDRLLQTSQQKSELMHMVAHDLRSPLGAIQIGLELMQLDPPLAESSRALTARRVNESADLMARLINNLLSAQNVEEGRFSLKFVTDDAGRLARGAVESMYTVAQHKHIIVEALVPAEPVALTTDFVALQQVVDNLLSNALKYSPPGTRVEIAVQATATHCRFEVRDQGPGVQPDERERIFEKFGRGSAQPTQGEKSSGLGLWIVRRFVVALFGRVWCEPGPGAIGAVFVVEVPLTPPAA